MKDKIHSLETECASEKHGRTYSMPVGTKEKPPDTVSLASTDTIVEMFQEELKASLAQKKGQKVWKRITCPEHQVTDCFYISLKSTPEDVAHWLKIKGFSERQVRIACVYH